MKIWKVTIKWLDGHEETIEAIGFGYSLDNQLLSIITDEGEPTGGKPAVLVNLKQVQRCEFEPLRETTKH